MHTDSRAIFFSTINRDFELAWQEGKLGMESRPLTDDLAPRAGINQFIGSHASELVGGGVANAVTAGLNGMHLYFSQMRQNVRNLLQFWPVELNVLTGTEMRIALVVLTGNKSQRSMDA